MIDTSPVGHALAAVALQTIIGLTFGMWVWAEPLGACGLLPVSTPKPSTAGSPCSVMASAPICRGGVGLTGGSGMCLAYWIGLCR